MSGAIRLFLVFGLLSGALSGCGSGASPATSDSGIPDGSGSPVATETPRQAQSSGPVPERGGAVDFTALSSTLVYAEVYHMMATPEDYLGRTVTMKGQFAVYGDIESGAVYFACVIADAAACCQQGLEFVLCGTPAYPDDYPQLGDEITVTGIFQTYEENGNLYCHLVEAALSA